MIQVSDAIKEETAQAKYKYNTKLNFLYLSTRNAFPSRLVTTSMLKYVYRFNYHRTWDKIINNNMSTSECLQCSEIEMWKYVILCQKNKKVQVEFIQKLLKDLSKVKPRNIDLE
jgi:hypothetical protein